MEAVGALAPNIFFNRFHILFLEQKVVSTQGDKSDYSSMGHAS